MTLDMVEATLPTSGGGGGARRVPRNPSSALRRSRLDSNDSENSTGSSRSQDSKTMAPAIHLVPGSAPSSRTSSFRGDNDRPPSSTSSRRSPASAGNRKMANGRSGGSSGNSNNNINNANISSNNSPKDDANGNMGPRRSSMPNVAENFLAVPSMEDAKDNRLRRVRSFKTTSKGGVVNRGDSFKKKSTHSLMSTGSAITDVRQQLQAQTQQANLTNNNSFVSETPPIPTYYRVIMMGAEGCGKSSMAKQFMTSDFIGVSDDQESQENTVTVLLDGEESTIEFIDPPDRNVIEEGLQQLLDAYVVVFAINDHSSFELAQNLVRYLRVDHGTDRVIVLVANKIDLVRKRKVSADEARLVAETYDCKYTETSAALNHSVDELLVGILTQIRLHMRIPFTTISFPGKEQKSRSEERKERKRALRGPRGFFSRLFRRSTRKKTRPCENLYAL